jgi:Flp pilus assembly protein TadD
MDEEARAKLASLGYVGGVAPAGSGPRANPRDMVPLFRKFEEAIWAIHDHRYDEARTKLTQLVASDPQNPIFRSSLARVERQTGHLADAVKLYRDAVAATPGDADAWYNLAVALQESGQKKEALIAIREAIRHDDSRPEAHNTLGIALGAEGDLASAQREFEKAIALDSKNATAYNNLGNILRQLNRFDEADAAYRKSIQLAPRYADPLNGLGTLEVQRDRPQEALPLFERALMLAPEYYEVHLNRGIAMELLGRKREAAAEYSLFLEQVHGKPEFISQRQAAEQLLARLKSNTSS